MLRTRNGVRVVVLKISLLCGDEVNIQRHQIHFNDTKYCNDQIVSYPYKGMLS